MPDPNNPNMPNPERKQESTIFTVVKEYTDKIDETVRDTYAWKQAFIEKARNSNNRYIQMLASCVLNGSVFGNTL